MKWAKLMRGVVAKLNGDTQLQTTLAGAGLRRAEADEKVVIPGLYWQMLGESRDEMENEVPVLVQIDMWTRDETQQVEVENHLERLLHHPRVFAPYNGTRSASTITEAIQLPDDKPGVLRSTFTIRFSVLR